MKRWMGLLAVVMMFFAGCGDDNDNGTISQGDEDLQAEIEIESETEAEEEAVDPWADLEGVGSKIVDILGVSTHMKQSAGENAHRDFEFERYAELGGIRIREDYHWHHIEPEDDQWNFDTVSTQVDMARENGVSIMAMLAYSVDWAIENDETSTIDPAEYGEFAGKVAEQFCDDIEEYEIWNEPNLYRFWKPVPDPDHYGKMLKAAYTEIKAVCPKAKVVFGGCSSWDETWPLERWAFLRETFVSHPDICDYFDIYGMHPYTLNQKPSPEQDYWLTDEIHYEGQSWMTQCARDQLTTIGCPDKPLSFTEMGWPSYEITEEDQGRYLARSVLIAAADEVDSFVWYTFWDGEPRTTGWRPHEEYFGLFGYRGEDGTERREKPSYTAMKGLSVMLGDSRFARDLSPLFGLPNDVYLYVFLDDDGLLTLTAWDGRDMPDHFQDGTDDEGGADTSYDLELEFPESASTVTIYDIDGVETGSESADQPLQITLTPSVQYLRVE